MSALWCDHNNVSVTINKHHCYTAVDLFNYLEAKELSDLVILQICRHFQLMFFFELAANCC